MSQLWVSGSQFLALEVDCGPFEVEVMNLGVEFRPPRVDFGLWGRF